ncbi:MAG: hypothetical protein NC402_02610 [Prevotella sp.]|nr:hypothetical protein [Prevotella sp.]MCM1074840.1 hypothetical protein [Ruminococcus sp.]
MKKMTTTDNTDLLQSLYEDVSRFAKNFDTPLMNERDLQVRLAMHLKSCENRYDDVMVEYAVPFNELCFGDRTNSPENFPWRNDIYVDIAVRQNGRYALLELKYATRNLPKGLWDNTRFGSKMKSQVCMLKNQGAVDIVSYNYCKDIRRIEALTDMYPNIVGGIAMIITNNHLFWERPKSDTVAHSRFALYENQEVKDVHWQKISKKIIDSHRPFSLDNTYKFTWKDTSYDKTDISGSKMATGSKFRFMTTVISKETRN